MPDNAEIIESLARKLEREVYTCSETAAGEAIENLARKLERMQILLELKECKTLEDFQELVQKYENLCNDDNN
ncbi:MAG: hypothetical protein LIO44_04035 [Eubacterium sp.]|nr:hypothetical protein [Eubacterium sp.]